MGASQYVTGLEATSASSVLDAYKVTNKMKAGEKIRIVPGCSPMETGGSQMESATQERGDVYLYSAVKLRCFLPWAIVAKEDLHKSKGQPEKSFGGYET